MLDSIPSSFKLNNKTITVTFDNEYCISENLFGECDFTTRNITLSTRLKDRKLKKSEIEKTFYHELCHAMLDACGRHNLKWNEDFVESLGQLLYEYLHTKK